MSALLLLVLFHVLTYPWPFLNGRLALYNNTDLHHGTSEPVGCNIDRFDWCATVKPVNKWIFYVAYALCIGIAFPSINLSMNTLYSRIIGPRRQETLQGIQQMFGSAARFTGPLMISNIYHFYGPTVSWQIEFIAFPAKNVKEFFEWQFNKY
ncbi:unnamed protein product [Bursaphelenchus xylophilus]|uniref:(pine wood nematode) hypothetical protein n=1 Tax=Bursaphelenchus xylophilus TaxID=6326 RepID=A0A1I7S6D2_BURXY|nr:unnamed protein product [Bursaphelenchus xylophilus]CAG9128119.1 unnamed protein product [Bursaphelenchus xylophilus]